MCLVELSGSFAAQKTDAFELASFPGSHNKKKNN